jgi:hypothetical protein
VRNVHDKVFVALKQESRFSTKDGASPVEHWTNWARSITGRHERITARQGLLVMTLVGPFRIFTSINQRFEKFALTMFPRIQISIRPILQEIMREQLSSVSLIQNSSTNVVRNQYEHRSQPVSMTFISSPHQTNQTTTRITGNVGHNVMDARQMTGEGRARKEFVQTPLRRLFARLHTPGSNVVSGELLRANETQTIAERVVQEHTRVELRKRGDMVVRKQLSADVAAEKRSGEIEAQFASSRTSGQQPWLNKPPQLPQINVEQLTEQVIRKIDHRITAYRERLGRGY